MDFVYVSNFVISFWYSEIIFNVVRLGVVMYGLNLSGIDLDLFYFINFVLSLEFELVYVK